MIEELLEDLRVDEGWRNLVYDDATGKTIKKGSVVKGHPTIGHGFLVSSGEGLPVHIGEQWLNYAAMQKWSQLCAREPWILDQPEHIQRALGNMSYQMGVDGLLGFRKMLQALEDGDRRWARIEALDSDWAAQTPERAARVTGLIR